MTELGSPPPSAGRGARPLSRALFSGALVALALVVLVLLVRSLPWPLTMDAALMHYVAWRIAEGDAPYRDLFDMNFPGTYLIHLAVVRALGAGDAAWRAFELAWLAASAVLVYRLAPGPSRVARAGAALLAVGYHLALGRGGAGERDFFIAVFLLAASERVAAYAERGGISRLLLGGAAAGAAATIKPTAFLMAAALAAIVLVAARRRRERWLGAVLAFGAASLLPGAVALAWLWSRHALSAFVELAFGFTLRIYPYLLSGSLLGKRASLHQPLLALMGALALAAVLLAWRRRALGPRHAIAAAGIAFGIVHYVVQRHGWPYQLSPLASFAAVLAPAAAADGRAREAVRRAAAIALAAVVALIAARGLRPDPSPFQVRLMDQVDRIEEALAPRVSPGGRVQVVDTVQGAVHALLRLKLRQPTRFLYDFPLLAQVPDASLEGYRAEFLAGLAAHPGALVVVTQFAGAEQRGYARLDGFPALVDLLDRQYRLDVDAPGFRIYVPRGARMEEGHPATASDGAR